MRQAILLGNTPNLYLLQYSLNEMLVRNLKLIPHFAFTVSILEERPPLSPDAQRAGWVGCNFLLDRVPPDAQIEVVRAGEIQPAEEVRRKYERLRPIEGLDIDKRGWTLDVLNVVRSLRKEEFALSDVYAHASSLAAIHPRNRHVRDKIRQQLQILRDMGLLKFLGHGSYRFT
jgi:type II restriction enzyme